MRICFISTEIFAWNKYGGFGKATRILGKELIKKGIEVFAVVPRRKNQLEFEVLDGIKVWSFPNFNPFSAKKLFKKCDADIYHSEEPSMGTFLAMKEMPQKIHLVTSRDPKFFNDWLNEFIHPSYNKIQVLANYLYEDNFLVKKTVRNADKVFCAARFLNVKVKKKYSLKNEALFLPTPVEVPQKNIVKSEQPTICYLARWDRRKRPELFFKLAASFPDVKFIAAGKSRDINYDNYLRKKFLNLKNVTMTGFINQFETNKISEILEQSWILVNTAVREGLPNSFLEALAHKCAILSSLNPENVTERFGFHVKDGRFEEGLEKLLENDAWKNKGDLGQNYIKENYELNRSIHQHIKMYKDLLNRNGKENVIIN
ncbi:MAG: glycosyltransferase family 4 protein [Ignavibacteria bacterium]